MESEPKQETQKTALQIAVEKIIEASKTITPEESLKSFQDAGIIDSEGKLTKPYIGIEKVIARPA